MQKLTVFIKIEARKPWTNNRQRTEINTNFENKTASVLTCINSRLKVKCFHFHSIYQTSFLTTVSKQINCVNKNHQSPNEGIFQYTRYTRYCTFHGSKSQNTSIDTRYQQLVQTSYLLEKFRRQKLKTRIFYEASMIKLNQNATKMNGHP